MNKKFKFQNKGITLVALVITVIILLILAGISIATLTGSGLFERARLAEQESKNAQELEDITLKDYENTIEKYINNNREGKNIHIEKGSININFSKNWAYQTIQFEKEFDSIPDVYYRYGAGTSGGSVYVGQRTTKSFEIGYASFFSSLYSDTIEWIAIESSVNSTTE